MILRVRIQSHAAAWLLCASLAACGGGSPSGSSPPVTGVPQPTPSAPSEGSGNVGATCSLGAGDPNARCDKASSQLLGAVLGAMDQLVQQQPQLFDKSEEAGGAGSGQYRVLDKEAYLNGLVGNLAGMGYCAQRDPDDFDYERIQLKNENGFSETFDVLLSSGFMRRGGSYFETCTPASFPVDRGDLPPPGSGCGKPYPPPISRMTCKVHFVASAYDTLDSTAIVGPDTEYCAQAGFTDGRALCPVRPEGSPERIPCETWRVGTALDTGRPGPTWTKAGQFCTGSSCENHPENQYQLLVYHTGSYEVCANTGACCSVEVQR
jgi:hypothetical protein